MKVLITRYRVFRVLLQLVEEKAAKAGSEAAPSQDAQQELSRAQEELNKTKEELNKLKEEGQKKVNEVISNCQLQSEGHCCSGLTQFCHLFNQTQKFQHELEEVQKENQQTKDKLQEVQSQVVPNRRSCSIVLLFIYY